MATLLRPSVELDQQVRDSAMRNNSSIHSWWMDAAKEKLEREQIDLNAIAASINSDPRLREVLNRLAQ